MPCWGRLIKMCVCVCVCFVRKVHSVGFERLRLPQMLLVSFSYVPSLLGSQLSSPGGGSDKENVVVMFH